ncbi:MAG: glycoside hydrolase family 2 protein [Saprospiraceae bacterium]|nr:glycoside hydrolase family 2 protein [Saprospiraceae bacterium]
MKSYLTLSITCFISFTSLFGQMQIALTKNWFYTQADTIQWQACTIPGNTYTALLENQKIPNPFFGDNEKNIQWVSEKNWLFKTKFDIDSKYLKQDNIHLECPGLDTDCSLYLNNQYLGKANNAFRHWTFDVKQLLNVGENELLIQFNSASKLADSLYALLETKLPGEKRVVLRKPQFHFGWDFGPVLMSSGITDAVYLNAWNSVKLKASSIHTITVNDTIAMLRMNLALFIQDTLSELDARLHMNGQILSFPIQKVYGQQQVSFDFTLENPKLWWPNGTGEQNLYPCKIEILKNETIIAEKSFKTGIRTITLIHEPDRFGKSFYFLINGKKIFCKGANYIPPDILYTQTLDPVSIIKTAVESNFNMLRIWGGGRYESDSFYQTCDENGILIWQDFMYACGMYPGDSSFLLNASIEAEEQVQRLSQFACIALWCGNNENNEGWHRWGWQFLISSENKERIWNDYQKLFNAILPNTVRKYSNLNSYWESSPLFGRGDDKFISEGDAHDWGLWHDEMPFEKLEDRIPRFMSEFGFQSLPPISTIKQFASENELDLDSHSLRNHQKHPRGNKLINQYINRDFPEAKNFESLIYLNQITQAEGICKIIRAHRKAKPYCMGSLYWQFNDCWPGISWSGRDYFGKWKALQHEVKNAFRPILFTANANEMDLTIHAVSDFLEPTNVELEILIQDFTGNVLKSEKWNGTIEENSSLELLKIPFNFKKLDIRETHYILLKWKYKNQWNSQCYFLDKFNKLKLNDPEIAIDTIEKTTNGFFITLKSKQLAKSVYIYEDATSSFFPNYFDLNPGEFKKIHCITNQNNLNNTDLKMISLFNFINN